MPHWIYWYNESLNILLTPIRQKILYNFFTRFIKRKLWDQKIALGFLSIGRFFRIITFNDDITKCKVQRAYVLWEEAVRRGINMRELLLFGHPFDCYIAEKVQESKQIIFSGLPRPAGYSNNWLDLMDDKWLLKQKLQENNFPVPKGASCSDINQAKNVFEKIQKRVISNQKLANSKQPQSSGSKALFVIVKPRSGSRGRHTTTFVNTEKGLRQAFKIAKQLCHWVMVEEQLFGPVYRATVVNFRLEGVLRGDSPQVMGDGLHTIRELIKIKNLNPHNGVKDILIDENVERFVGREMFDFQTAIFKDFPNINFQNLNVLDWPIPTGLVLQLSEKIGVGYGGSSSEDFEICHEDNQELFVRAAKVLGDPIVGFDFIIPDITQSYKKQNCGFIEVNSLPFINLHHNPLLGKPRNVAAAVWRMVGI